MSCPCQAEHRTTGIILFPVAGAVSVIDLHQTPFIAI